ncbi:MAG: hypothetical protein AAFP04_06550 [Myxococcota bacterium]
MTNSSSPSNRASTPEPGVNLPVGQGASSFMLSLLRDVCGHYPETFGATALPNSSGSLKKTYASLLVEFEQRRCASPKRHEIASWLQREVATRTFLRDSDGRERPLKDLSLNAEPLALEHLSSSRGSGWRPQLNYRNKQWQGHDIAALIDDLEARHRTNATTAAALRRATARLDSEGELKLRGERFVLLGAGAEIAPTEALLRAGGTVLWMDIVPPAPELHGIGGELHHACGRSDLLLYPDRVAATIADFAGQGSVHVGLFAYGPGQGREWRLGAAMNAALRALPSEMVRSIGLLVSPTTPIELHEDDANLATQRLRETAGWRRWFAGARLLRRSRARADLPRVCDSIVPLQGVSYQAAQWLEKTIAMEAIATDNPQIPISANVAPVTMTASMNHPVFQAAFRGAPVFEVEAFDSQFTRTLAAMLYIEDILGEKPDRHRHLHGGVLPLPFSLESAIRVAAAVGFVRR